MRFTSLLFFLSCVTLSFAQESSNLEFDSLFKLAESNVYRNPQESKKLASEILIKAKAISSHKYEAKSLKIIGGTYFVQGDYDFALKNFLDAFQIYTDLKDTTMMSRLLSNVGLVYKNIDDYDNSLKYYKRALKLVSPNDTSTKSRLINNIGVVFQKLNEFDTAKYYLKKSFELKSQLSDEKGKANTLTNLGIIAFEQKELSVAITYHQRALRIEESLNRDEGIAKCMNNIGSTYIQMNRYDSAFYYAGIALEIGKRLGTKEQIKQSYKTLTLCADARQDFKNAFRYQTLFMQMKDSLFNEDISRKLGRLESRLELASKEAEIEVLSFQNQVSALQSEKFRNQLIMAVTGALLVIALLIVLHYQRSKKAHVEKLAQEFQIEALMKRLMELNATTTDLTSNLNFDELNGKLHTPLTEREFDALKWSVLGKTNSEIAKELFITNSTVKFHLRNTYSKMGVGNRKEAYQFVAKV